MATILLVPGAAGASASGGTVACGSGAVAFSQSSLPGTGELETVGVSFSSELEFPPTDPSALLRVEVESISSSDASAPGSDWGGVGSVGSSGAGYAPRPAAATAVQLRAVPGRSYTVTVVCEELGGAYTDRPFHASDTASFRVQVAQAPPPTSAGNLAPDPGFETDPAEAFYSAGNASFDWASDTAHSGQRSLKLVASGPAGALSRWMSQTTRIPVSPGRTYRVAAWLRTGGATGDAALATTFYDGGYLPSIVAARTLSGTTDWTEVSQTVTAPAGVSSLRLELRLYGAGTLWADDVSVATASTPGQELGPPASTSAPQIDGAPQEGGTLRASTGTWSSSPTSYAYQWRRCDAAGASCVDIPGAAAPVYTLGAADAGRTVRVHVTATNAAGTGAADAAPTPQIVPANTPNLAPDPGFEADPSADFYSAGSAAFSWAVDVARSGSRSLELVSAAAPGSLARWMTQTTRISVTPGKTYRLSVWLRTSGQGTAALAATFYDGTYLPSLVAAAPAGGAADWAQVSQTVTAPAGASSLRLEFRLYGAGTLWIDDASVVEA